jgi:predicted unusual protein kinase regulating ubiquinone biosynthesis (AarF/ABC1/UbiB family)
VVLVVCAAIAFAVRRVVRGRARTPDEAPDDGVRHAGRRGRNVEVARLGARLGRTYVSTAARKTFASAERAEALDRERELRTAEDISKSLGRMKGALMKVGQMASYLDDGLPEPLRLALSQLQAHAPPMSAGLAADVVQAELGAPPERLFRVWDPEPIAAASIGQVHRAVWWDSARGEERAVAVKVQYPGAAEAIRSDLANAELLGSLMTQLFRGLDPGPLVSELQARIGEELDYRLEAANQQAFADFYRSHPFIGVPSVVGPMSTARVLTTDLAAGATWRELLTWDQAERDLAAEAIFRFVFRSLYRFQAFNGDPHPGNYLFRPGGQVTFLDFGLVKHFDDAEMATFQLMIRYAVLEPDDARFRETVEGAGLLRPGAPVSTQEVGRYFAHFYNAVRDDRTITWTPEYASATVRQVFGRDSPIAHYVTVPAMFVIIQRINLGLYAILGQLRATANYRRVAEELWPMVSGPPSTPLGQAEADWLRMTSAQEDRQRQVPEPLSSVEPVSSRGPPASARSPADVP